MDCKSKTKKIFFLFFIVFLSCTQPEFSRTEFAMGTVCSISLFEQGQDSIYNDIFSRIREIENMMSVNISASDISRINTAAGIEPVQVHEDVFRVIERAKYFAEHSGGAFDPAIGPLVNLWGISGSSPRVPSQKEIEEILPLINWRDIELDANTHSVFLKRCGMALDLGAIAKGYAAGEAAAIIGNAGIERALIDLGGDIVICGEKKDKTPWRAGIQNPNERQGVYLGVLQIQPKAPQISVVTSGVYERFFENEGKRYHHIFSPLHGFPAENELLSVTIIAHNAMDADALSTAVFVLGFEEGIKLLESFPGTEAVFIFKDKNIRKTTGANFTLTDKSFYLIK